MLQWNGEVDKRSPGDMSVYLYHGAKRERDPRKLAKYDIVFTTYSIVGRELSVVCDGDDKGDQPVMVTILEASLFTNILLLGKVKAIASIHPDTENKQITECGLCTCYGR